MLGAVGDDQLGVAALEALRANGVQTDHVVVNAEAPTGVALIAVGVDGENQISVAPGANAALEPSDVVGALETLEPHVLLVSLEVPERTVRAALEWARDHDVTTILNPAPPQPWARDLLELATYVTPNEHERAALGAIPAGVVVIETRGPEGAVIHRPDGSEEPVPAPSVPVVDTTGAGDCFNGVLAAGLAWGTELSAAVRRRGPGRVPLRGHRRRPRGHARHPGDRATRGSGSGARPRASRGTRRPTRARTRRPGPSPGCSSRSTRR